MMLCDNYSWGHVKKCLLTLDRELTTDHSNDCIKVQFDEPMNFIGVTYRNMGKWLVNRNRNDSRITVSPKRTLAWVTVYKS